MGRFDPLWFLKPKLISKSVTFFSICLSDYLSHAHSPSHDLQPLTVAATTPAESAPATTGSGGVAGQLGGVSCSSSAVPLVDKDYASFETHATQTSYNYLDPNFFPAS